MHLEKYGLTRDALMKLVDAAIAAQVSEIGITEHASNFVQCRRIYPKDNPWIHDAQARNHHDWDLETYVGLLEAARDEGLPVKMAIEWDYCPGHEADLEYFLLNYDWDFTVGSVHWLPGRAGGWWGFDIADQADEWLRRSVAAVYAEYFGLLADAASTGFFDIMAHPDVVKVFGYRPEGGPAPFYTRAVEAIAASGACAEVSTAGWRKPVAELYPAQSLLAGFRAKNIPIVISSDAHLAEHVGYQFDQAEKIVREVGYRTRSTFTRRRRDEVAL
jgi:histidinol-phosphatase (PHP family)